MVASVVGEVGEVGEVDRVKMVWGGLVLGGALCYIYLTFSSISSTLLWKVCMAVAQVSR